MINQHGYSTNWLTTTYTLSASLWQLACKVLYTENGTRDFLQSPPPLMMLLWVVSGKEPLQEIHSICMRRSTSMGLQLLKMSGSWQSRRPLHGWDLQDYSMAFSPGMHVHAFKHGWQFPLLYCFLPGQTRQVYSQCLGHHGQCLWLAVSSATSEYGCDRFRTGHSPSCGWKSQWDIGQGCFFYFVQAVRRQVQHLRLQSLYKTNATFNKFIFKLLAQSLCPVSYVWLAWISAAPPNTHNQAVAILCQYFEDTWLDGSYRLSVWNHYSNESA